MSFSAFLGIVGIGIDLVLSVLLWWFHRQAVQAAKDRDEALADLAAAKAAAAAERARDKHTEVIQDAVSKRFQREVLDPLLYAHPELEPEYLGLVVRLSSAAAGEADAPVPRPPGAAGA